MIIFNKIIDSNFDFNVTSLKYVTTLLPPIFENLCITNIFNLIFLQITDCSLADVSFEENIFYQWN